MLNKYVVVDLETTGNLPKKGDRIIQFAAVVIENGKIIEKFSSLLNPRKQIPAFIEELTGINNEMVQDAPDFSEIAPKIVSLLENSYFVAHNVLFDLSFLQQELIQAGFEGFYGPVLDTVELARILYPTADGYKLTELAEMKELNHDRPHQADSDAFVTAELLLIFFEKLLSLPKIVLNQLSQLSGGLKSDVQQFLDELLIEKNKQIEELSRTLEIFNGIVLKNVPTNETNKQNVDGNDFPDNDEEKARALKKAFPAFERREGQFKMMDMVYESFLEQRHSVIEAGTGIGKSIGYLLPAAYFSKKKRHPIIVSTHTIQLQEQLLKKEIPLLQKIVPFQLKAVLLKGRGHYISLKRFVQTLSDENDNYDTTLTKMQILIWLMETETGDQDELNLSSGGLLYWNKVKNDQFTLWQNEEWKEKDFYLKARKEAEDADIIITNHSLLLADLTNHQNILPECEYVVLDEGHHFGKAASKFFGRTLDYLSIRMLLAQLGRYEERQLFYILEELLDDMKVKKDDIIHSFELNNIISDLFYEIDEFFKVTSLFVKRKAKNSKGMNRLRVKLNQKEKGEDLLALFHSAERCAFLLRDIYSYVNERITLIKGHEMFLTIGQMKHFEELLAIQTDIEVLRKNFQEMMLPESNLIRWVEMDLRSPQNVTTIFAQPISISDDLSNHFFKMKKSVVITSATLTVNHSFDFIMKELGIHTDHSAVLKIPSPFNFKNQVKILIPEDLPEIKTVSVDEYVISITEQIISIAEATKGRMLILFTSQEMLQKTFELIKESGFLSEFAILAQGITSGSKTRLTRYFQKYEKAILLGSSSFWEGIDIPGEDLSCLVIVRLPFSPPDEPYTEAKCEYIMKNGGNAFSDYSLPDAVLRFKQGFGRLIRAESDKGVMIIFDKRIITTKYGNAFLKSIPTATVESGPIDQIVEIVKEWL
ncbi:MAG: ATP-dependent DNA helicase DinG [Bacillota bacterium]|nr:ATP-dependent DNA helicase DinG [Bacillota bacterium]